MTIAAVSGQNGGAGANATSISSAYSSDVSADSLIVVCGGQMLASDAGAFVVGDAGKLSGTATIDTIALAVAPNIDSGDGHLRFAVWSAIVTGAGSLTMEVNPGDSGKTFIGIHEYTGNWDGTRLEDSASDTDAGTTTAASSGDGTSDTDGLFIGGVEAVCSSDNADHTEDGSFTSIHEQNIDPGGNPGTFASSFRISSGGLTDAMTYTLDASPLGHVIALAVFKEAAAAAGGLPSFHGARRGIMRGNARGIG